MELIPTAKKMLPQWNESRIYWHPAPSKLEVAPYYVSKLLFPQYVRAHVGRFDQLGHNDEEVTEDDGEDEDEVLRANRLENEACLKRLLAFGCYFTLLMRSVSFP